MIQKQVHTLYRGDGCGIIAIVIRIGQGEPSSAWTRKTGFKPVVLHLKIDLAWYPVHAEGLGKYIYLCNFFLVT